MFIPNLNRPLIGGWWFSALLNKHPYSRCLNPHIGIYRPQHGGYMLRFPAHWKIWNAELNRTRRKQFHPRFKTNRGCRKVFHIGPTNIFMEQYIKGNSVDGYERATYLKLLHKTYVWRKKYSPQKR